MGNEEWVMKGHNSIHNTLHEFLNTLIRRSWLWIMYQIIWKHPLTVLKAPTMKARYWQDEAPCKGSRAGSSQIYFPAPVCASGPAAAHTQCNSVFTPPSHLVLLPWHLPLDWGLISIPNNTHKDLYSNQVPCWGPRHIWLFLGGRWSTEWVLMQLQLLSSPN